MSAVFYLLKCLLINYLSSITAEYANHLSQMITGNILISNMSSHVYVYLVM